MPKPDQWATGTWKRRQSFPKLKYHASPWAYVAWWVGLLLLHCANVIYYLGVARLYTDLKGDYIFAAMRLLSIGIPDSEHDKISAIHTTIAAIHIFFIVLMVGSSIRARKLAFQPDLSPLLRLMSRAPIWLEKNFARVAPRAPSLCARSLTSNNSDRVSSLRTQSRQISNSIINTGSMIFARDGLLGVDSVYFDHVLLLRELVETSLQTYQVYRMSQLLPRLWLIRFYVALLVINCWGVPILHRYYRDRETTRRMLCLLCDAVLDMVSSIGISLIIFATYAPQYNDPDGFGFPFANWFNDHWLANLQQEFQIMVVVSWADMASRLVFALGLLQCMEAMKEMLTPPTPMIPFTQDKKSPLESPHVNPLSEPPVASIIRLITAATTTGSPLGEDHTPVEPLSRVPEVEEKAEGTPTWATATRLSGQDPTLRDLSRSATVPASSVKSNSRWRRAVHFLVHVAGPIAFVLWGFLILITHFIAETHHSDAACELTLKPWFTNKPGCSLIEVNCHNLQSTGQDNRMSNVLETYDPERAARVVFRHCPALTLTPKLQEFRNVAGLKIYNSTVVSWEENAAITSKHHPSLRSVFIVRTTFPNGRLPPGLLSKDFPPTVKDMITCVTNLHTIPDDLDMKWSPGIQIALEYSQFTDIPMALLRLQPSLISMAGSLITSVPAAVFETPSLGGLLLSSTRIEELPREVTQPSSLGVLFLHYTNIKKFWSWIDGMADRQARSPRKLFNGHGTPYCRELAGIMAGNLASFSATPAPDDSKLMDMSTPETRAFAQRVIDCTPGFTSTHFPLPLEDATHGLR